MGNALSVGINAINEPIQAPIPKRTLPTIEFAEPAALGNFSKIDAMELEEINGFFAQQIRQYLMPLAKTLNQIE